MFSDGVDNRLIAGNNHILIEGVECDGKCFRGKAECGADEDIQIIHAARVAEGGCWRFKVDPVALVLSCIDEIFDNRAAVDKAVLVNDAKAVECEGKNVFGV